MGGLVPAALRPRVVGGLPPAKPAMVAAKAAAAGRKDVDQAAGSSGRATEDDLARVLYIGHLPHGFYEKQLLGYFSQFGKVTRVRVSRSKKTARAKHYAFVQFQHPEVAKVAADAMDGYFLFTQRLVVKLMPASKVHPKLFVGGNRKFRVVPWRKIERRRHGRERTPEEHAVRVARLIAKDKRRQLRIAAAGIEYEYPSLAEGVPIKPHKVLFDD